MLHSLPPNRVSADRDIGEFELAGTANAIAAVLSDACVVGVEGTPREIMTVLDSHSPDVVFNLCEAPRGRPDQEAHVAAVLEWLNVRFTGSGSETLALCRRKDWTNAVLAAAGVAIPRSGVFPCIVKPAGEDGSSGIRDDSVCGDVEAVARAQSRITGPVVVQEYLAGREFHVAVWGRRHPDYVSIGETRFLNGLRILTYTSKWDVESADFMNSPLYYDSDISPALRESLALVAKASWRAVGARGYLRVDMRLDADGQPRVLDVNPNPELGVGVGVRRAAEEAGWSWEEFVRKQVEWA